MSRPTVTIYTTSTCVYCEAEKTFLQQHGVDFTEVAVDSDETAAREMIELSGQMGVPFTVIATEEADAHIVGFNEPQLSKALAL